MPSSAPAGVKTMAMLGRYRRRMTSASICHLIAMGQPPAGLLDTPAHLARAAALAIQVGVGTRWLFGPYRWEWD